ncbi:hypothetical protein GCG54_00010853 [Colletotrichum gloeosporioides]|uniref:Zn(2)-C6 fungal-type domain-containing protein n=1 Tax=Colletotrichum gloeosporioides TaxID=474922 RepID=A0A8H4FGP6_COLGL|nr:uncharacterized protein GCG54_00010853 [Colletotrichum gloeosporioides]KAF3801171.1 hypothetical protein GCG54_00010853 [Colletotrichum gloeosporioides]
MKRTSSPSDIPPIACIRCRHRKKKCDHALPKCGECKRAGSECVRFQERKPRDAASVPWEYVKGLEMRLSQVERSLANCMVLIRKQGNPSNQPLPGQSTIGSEATLDPPSLKRSPSTVATEVGSSLQSSPNWEIMERMQAINAERKSPSLAASLDGVITMIQTPSATHDNTFLTNPPSDDDIGLLRRADLACYFQLVHPNWSFLDENLLVEWFQETKSASDERCPPTIISLTSSKCSSTRGCPHIARSTSLYSQALVHCLPDAFLQGPSAQLKAHLLLLVYALHSPNHFQLRDNTGKSTLEIARRLSNYEAPGSFTSLEATTTLAVPEACEDRGLLIHCYSVYEVIASTWPHQLHELVDVLDEKIWNQSIWLTFDGGLIDANFEHLFTIRRTQSKIRRFWKQMRTLNGQSDYRIQNTHEIKAELDQWKGMIPLISSNTDKSTNCHPLSMLMLYNYCICCLFQNELAVPNIDDHAVLLTAASENARCFRRIQEHRPMVYCTWTTLLEQFTVGIILISCFWGTPYIYRSTAFQAPDTLQALEDCGSTLSRFANRWKDAEVYYETYTLLTPQTPISFPDNSDFEFPDQLKPQISGLTQTLEERGVSMAVLAMIGRIISSPTSTREYP